MTWLSDSTQQLAGAWRSSAYAGHGIRGDAVPQIGAHGASILWGTGSNIALPAEAADEFRALILTRPAGLPGLVIGEDSALEVPEDSPAGTHVGTWRGYKGGVVFGPDPSTYTIVIGASALTGGATLDDVAAGGGLGVNPPSDLGGGATLDDVAAGGGLGVNPPSALGGGLTLDNGSASGGFTDGAPAPPVFISSARFVRTVKAIPRKVYSMGTVAAVDPIDVAEEAPIDFIYTDELAGTGLTLVSAAFEVDLRSGDDANPQGILLGGHTFNSAADVVQQWVKGQVPSATYGVRCVAIDSNGTPRTAVARLSVKRL